MTRSSTFKRRVRARMATTGERYAAARRALLTTDGTTDRRRPWVSTPEVADSAVRAATGRGWDEWCDAIDGWPGHVNGHTAVAAHLGAAHGVDGWWAQTVTVGWERITGRRLPHQMADGTFTVGRSRTVGVDAVELRSALLDAAARAELFPGVVTELRSRPTAKALRVDVGPGQALFTLTARPDGRTKVDVTHAKLSSPDEVDEWRFWWGEWLEALDAPSA